LRPCPRGNGSKSGPGHPVRALSYEWSYVVVTICNITKVDCTHICTRSAPIPHLTPKMPVCVFIEFIERIPDVCTSLPWTSTGSLVRRGGAQTRMAWAHLRGAPRALALLCLIPEACQFRLDGWQPEADARGSSNRRQLQGVELCECGDDPSCDHSCDWQGCDSGCDHECIPCPPPPPSPPRPPSSPPPPSPPGGGAVYTRWGRTSCPSGSVLLYSGFMAGAHYDQSGSGSNFICMHPEPDPPNGANYGQQAGALLYGVEYELVARNTAMDNSNNHDGDAACAVCQYEAAEHTYQHWCAHTHRYRCCSLQRAASLLRPVRHPAGSVICICSPHHVQQCTMIRVRDLGRTPKCVKIH
jgi:hypothetical protein